MYTSQDIAGLLTDNEGFRLLIPQTEQQLGKKLRTADLQILAGLYDQIGLPADVIYLLVCHCVPERARRHGERDGVPPCGRSRRRAITGRSWASSTRPPPPRT